ncbi:hypothetical protein FO519_009708, partial [Halicephalobus sp. NKZ332]
MDRKVVVKNFEGSAEDLRALFTANGLVAELEDDWTPVNRAMHEQYDFVNFICKAKEYSEKEPPDVVQFSEKVWGAAALCVKQFYLNNFRILIKSHQARSVMVDLIGAGCNWKDAVFLGKTWKEAEMMFKRAYNQARIDEISSYCMYIEYKDQWISATILNKDYAVTALHCIPDDYRALGNPVILHDSERQEHNCHIHAMYNLLDYIVFKRDNGVFEEAPDLIAPVPLDKYIMVGFPFGEKKPDLLAGSVSSLSSFENGFFYGDSGGLLGFSGGGIFYSKTGSLMGIARGDSWEGRATRNYGNVLEMISAL